MARILNHIGEPASALASRLPTVVAFFGRSRGMRPPPQLVWFHAAQRLVGSSHKTKRTSIMKCWSLKTVAGWAAIALFCFPVFAEPTLSGADSLTWSVPVKSGVSAANLEQSLKDAATSNGLLFIGESPIYKQIEAITGKSYRYLNFLSFGDAVLMKSLLDYSDRYAAFFPIRIAVVEDGEGKLWLHSQNLDIMLQAGEGLSSAAQEAALALQDRVRKTINAAPLAERNALPLGMRSDPLLLMGRPAC